MIRRKISMSSMATFSFSGGARSCGLLLLLAAAAVLTCAAGAKIAELTSLQAPKAPLKIIHEVPGWERAWTHDAMEPIYNASLYPDLAPYQQRVRIASALGIANQLRRNHANSTRLRKATAVVIVRQGKLEVVTFPDFHQAYKHRVDAMVSELTRFQQAGHIKLEDTIFIYNARDVPMCTIANPLPTRVFTGFCLVPVFSPVKEVRYGKAYNDDLLVPLMSYPHEYLVEVPPEDKVNQMAMVTTQEEVVAMEGTCMYHAHKFYKATRGNADQPLVLVEEGSVAQASTAAAKQAQAEGSPLTTTVRTPTVWDGSTGSNRTTMSGLTPLPPASDALAGYRAVLLCETLVGFANLLHLNTVIFKSKTMWAEFYTRALEEGVHYEEVDAGFLLEVSRDATGGSHRKRQATMVERAQRFAYKYLGQRSRALFYEKAISEYNKLFGPGYMQATVDELPTGRTLTMTDILSLEMYPRAWRQKAMEQLMQE